MGFDRDEMLSRGWQQAALRPSSGLSRQIGMQGSTGAELQTEVRAIDEMLRSLPEKIARRILNKALRSGGAVYQHRARANLANHIRSGRLAESIRVSLSRRRGVTTLRIRAGGKGKWGDAFYAGFVELGTKPHLIKPKRRRSLFLSGIFRELVNHPGAQAVEFMGDAYQEATQQAIDTIANELRARLAEAVK